MVRWEIVGTRFTETDQRDSRRPSPDAGPAPGGLRLRVVVPARARQSGLGSRLIPDRLYEAARHGDPPADAHEMGLGPRRGGPAFKFGSVQ